MRRRATTTRIGLEQTRFVETLIGELHEWLDDSCGLSKSRVIVRPGEIVAQLEQRLVKTDSCSDRQSRAHLAAVIGKLLRSILAARARAPKVRHKAPLSWRIAVPPNTASQDCGLDFVSLDRALHELEKIDRRRARLLELRLFADLGLEGASLVLETPTEELRVELRVARAWLARAMKS